MKAIMDLHTHTFASGHGYSTLKENIDVAMERGLQYLGLSEHGPAMPGGPHVYFFTNYKSIPKQYGNLRLLCGVEANILDCEGRLDVEEYVLDQMDYVIASMHIPCVKPGSREINTRTAIQAMRNPYVKILGHPDDSRYPLDYKTLVQAAAEENVVLEVNNSSMHPGSPRPNARENIATMLQLCKEYRVPVIMGTDSHICYTVGVFDRAVDVLREVDFPPELIMNYDAGNLPRMLNKPL